LTGALLVAAFAVALPAGIRRAGEVRDLQVTVPLPEPHEIAPARGAPLARAVVGPPELIPRLERAGAPNRDDPGLWLRTWQVTYGRRWERQVTLPVLAGPFDPEGPPWPCAVAVRFSPRFFDGEEGSGRDVEAALERMVRAQFPFSVLGLRFAAVSHARIHLRPEPPGLHVTGHVVLADGAQGATELSFSANIALGERGGDLTAKVAALDLRWSGATRRDPLVELASIFVDVDAAARRVLGERIQGALGLLRLPRDPIAVFPDRPRDRFLLRLCDAPSSGPTGMTLRLRIAATLADPRLDPSVPGPPHLEARPELGPPPVPAPTFEAAVSAAGVEQALYLLWQGGQLGAWGRQEAVRSALRRKLQDRLAFEVGAVSPRLPPVVIPPGETGLSGAFRVRFGDLAIGDAGGRTVAAHGDLIARARVEGATLGLAGELGDLRIDCVDGDRGAIRLSPCFSDVVPVLRDSGLSSAGLPLELALPDRLLRVDLVLGTELSLRGLTGEVSGSPPMLRVRGEAVLTPAKAERTGGSGAEPPSPARRPGG
jgi:hypothetical protein